MSTVFALWLRNLKAFTRDRVRLIISIATPFFFIYVFSSIFQNDNIQNPVAYMTAGVIIATVFQTSLSIATSTIDDIVSGFMKEVLVSPTRRISVAAGQLLSAATVSTFQGVLILVIGLFTGIKFTSWTTIVGTIVTMILVGLVFAGLGLFLATVVKSTQTFQVVEMAITLPLTFLSGAYIPLALLPTALRYFAYINPMTYATLFFRTMVLEKFSLPQEQLLAEGLLIEINGFIVPSWLNICIVIAFGVLFICLSTLSFLRADFSKINRSPKSAPKKSAIEE